jgi:transcriptional regulator with XRE-family HTH domain
MKSSESPLLIKFANNLREARLTVGLSQEAVAEKAGLDRTYISSCERNLRNPTIRTIERIADALGVSPVDLIK